MKSHNEKDDNLDKLHGMAKVNELINYEIQKDSIRMRRKKIEPILG